jgi:hypothetical protein
MKLKMGIKLSQQQFETAAEEERWGMLLGVTQLSGDT